LEYCTLIGPLKGNHLHANKAQLPAFLNRIEHYYKKKRQIKNLEEEVGDRHL